MRRGFLCIALTLAGFALSPTSRAVDPPPDGGYPNQNTAEGNDALLSLSTGTRNTALGDDALESNTTGGNNTATGANALKSNRIGIRNTANGSGALFSNRGDLNTATGFQALASNITGRFNTANGSSALLLNTTGSNNTAVGVNALVFNTTGGDNTAAGILALQGNRTGGLNTAIGSAALSENTTGNGNTANGVGALDLNTTGDGNTAIGFEALFLNLTGNRNIAVGKGAGFALRGSDNIAIANRGLAGESNTIRIGSAETHNATFIAGIFGATVPNGAQVVANADGQLGTVVSSARFKEAIKPMDKASEAILQLEPVTFRYKHELDSKGIPQFGLVAEQVAKVNPELVVRDEQGKAYSVRYEAINAMLLNEFLKERRKVQELEKDLRSTIARQQKQIATLTAGLQKVSDQLQMSKAAPKMVAVDQ